jgi:hypothetical protein
MVTQVSDECVCARCHRDYDLADGCEPSKYCNGCVHDVVKELEADLADVACLDQAARHGGTRVLDSMPVKLPGIDEAHIHFVLMPIGVVSRRAAVEWLKAQDGPDDCDGPRAEIRSERSQGAPALSPEIARLCCEHQKLAGECPLCICEHDRFRRTCPECKQEPTNPR